ncbi:MAG TPA: CehA/McbA family metallohydrolase [Pyrinomonadaceae bacterium]
MNGSIATCVLVLITSVVVLVYPCPTRAQEPAKKLSWFKGNTHTHTTNSDGDSPPAEVVTWYKNNGYDFLVITDHEHITDVAPLNTQFADGGKFLVIQGQEVTDRFDKKPYHVNGLGLSRVVMPQRGTGVVANLQKNIDAVREAGGLAQVNHPNFGWAITAGDLMQVKGASLVEIYSGHPLVNMSGGGGVPSVEEMWDAVLTNGRVFYGVAVDDSHSLKRMGDRTAATPGHGWVVVRAEELTSSAILSALEKGEFYASTGVELDDYAVTSNAITISIKEKRGSKYRTQFIGSGGRILAESITNPAVYRFKGNERYVRAKVRESNGRLAWTQPVFRKR